MVQAVGDLMLLKCGSEAREVCTLRGCEEAVRNSIEQCEGGGVWADRECRQRRSESLEDTGGSERVPVRAVCRWGTGRGYNHNVLRVRDACDGYRADRCLCLIWPHLQDIVDRLVESLSPLVFELICHLLARGNEALVIS
jgi:hypothetical protein